MTTCASQRSSEAVSCCGSYSLLDKTPGRFYIGARKPDGLSARQQECGIRYPQEAARMATGEVKWFNDGKGYGFIEEEGGGGVVVGFSSSLMEEITRSMH